MGDRIRQGIAGAMTAIVAIPQCVALGVSAFAPFQGAYPALAQVAGFYSAIVAGLFVALGGRGQMSLSGPRIGATIVISGSLVTLLGTDGQFAVPPDAALGLILTVMMLAGLIQWSLGQFGYASLHHYLPKPVIVGLLSGVAVAMIDRQASNLAHHGAGFALVSLATFALAMALWLLRKSKMKLPMKEPVTRFGMVIATAFGIGLYFVLLPEWPSVGGTLGTIDRLWPWPEIGIGFESAARSLLTKPELFPTIISAAFMLAAVASIDTTTAYVNTKRKLGGTMPPDGAPNSRVRDDENNELKWHGLGNFFAPLIGGMTSSASDARAAAAVDAGGRTWITGVAYVAALATLVFSATAYPWNSFFPLAVISGLMLQIALILLLDQREDLLRYLNALLRAAKELMLGQGRGGATGIQRLKSRFAETALNGIAVMFVGAGVIFFDPLVAVTIGTTCSMVLFVLKLSQAQRHRHYVAVSRPSLESRPPNLAELARCARENCHVIKLHGDFFFLSRKRTNQLIAEIAEHRRQMPTAKPGYAIVDFDMAHEFDESGVAEIRALIERLQKLELTILMSYLPPHGPLRRLLGEALILRCELDPPLKDNQSYLVERGHVFENTERAINYVEDEYILQCGQGMVPDKSIPAALSELPETGKTVDEMLQSKDDDVRFWFVRNGKVTLRVKAKQSVASAEWHKVVAELGQHTILSARTLSLPSLQIEATPETSLIPIHASWLETLKRNAPAQATELLDYFLEHFADANATLQLEAVVIDH